MAWSDHAKGRYAHGWTCFRCDSSGGKDLWRGPFRWFCEECEKDVCNFCKEAEVQDLSQRSAQEPASESSEAASDATCLLRGEAAHVDDVDGQD
jgi:hypothetical protein